MSYEEFVNYVHARPTVEFSGPKQPANQFVSLSRLGEWMNRATEPAPNTYRKWVDAVVVGPGMNINNLSESEAELWTPRSQQTALIVAAVVFAVCVIAFAVFVYHHHYDNVVVKLLRGYHAIHDQAIAKVPWHVR